MYYVNTDLLVAFHCDRQVSYKYVLNMAFEHYIHRTTSSFLIVLVLTLMFLGTNTSSLELQLLTFQAA